MPTTITGTAADDHLVGGGSTDTISGLDGNDILEGRGRNDSLFGGNGDDTLEGGDGNDRLDGGAGQDVLDGGIGGDFMGGGVGDDVYFVDDLSDIVSELSDAQQPGSGIDRVFATINYVMPDNVEVLTLQTLQASNLAGTGNGLANIIVGTEGANALYGLAGNDQLSGEDGDDMLDGGTGADAMRGGIGNDIYFVDDTGDTAIELAGEGIERVNAVVDFTLSAEVENLVMRGDAARFGTGNGGDNTMQGSSGKNTLSGLAGADTLDGGTGYDTLDGGDGDDILTGGVGKDRQIGGTGLDQFVFRDGDLSVDRTQTDIVTDFSHAEADRLKLKAMDADTGVADDQKFAFIGAAAFTGVAGQLHYVHDGGLTFVEGDTNGDGAADFAIRLDGIIDLVAGDFVL